MRPQPTVLTSAYSAEVGPCGRWKVSLPYTRGPNVRLVVLTLSLGLLICAEEALRGQRRRPRPNLLGTPSPPDCVVRSSTCRLHSLNSPPPKIRGRIRGLGVSGEAFQRFGHFRVEHVSIARRRFQIGMVERALYQFQVAGQTQ